MPNPAREPTEKFRARTTDVDRVRAWALSRGISMVDAFTEIIAAAHRPMTTAAPRGRRPE